MYIHVVSLASQQHFSMHAREKNATGLRDYHVVYSPFTLLLVK